MSTRRIDKLIQTIESKGLDVQKKSNYWIAQCPAHDDNQASLEIKHKSSGKITIKCHAGCEGSDILKSLKLTWDILYPENQRKNSYSSFEDRIQATYPYEDEDGNLLFEAVRLRNPKSFRQRVPVAGGKDKWSIKGVRRVIYNLPEVIEAIDEGRTIFLVEGEKDADALKKRNLVSTTNPMGAGKWRSEYNSFFDNADVVILPDNDDPGREHAVEVAENLVKNAKTVRILQLPDLDEKGDVYDWLNFEGGTADELTDLAFETPVIGSKSDALHALDMENQNDNSQDDKKAEVRSVKNLFFEENHCIYANQKDERLVSDFAIDINSVVKDDRHGRIFYINIREINRGKLIKTDTIEVLPESLDDVRSFYKAIRPYTMGEIIQERRDTVKPLSIFKWKLANFEKPIVRRPDHIGFIEPTDNKNDRPFWLFGNVLICPAWKRTNNKGEIILDENGKPVEEHEFKIIEPNEADEFIVDEHFGFTLPIYQSQREKEELAPIINYDLENSGQFVGEVKSRLIDLIGGGDQTGRAKNWAKILLGYVVYHLFEKQLYHLNDPTGHTVMFYVYGAKGTGKTTYFNTFLRAFFGLHKTKDIKGNTVSVPGVENQMMHYSCLPVVWDEYNQEHAKIDYQHLNAYYHKSSRSVSDMDRAGRNKHTPIRSTLSITSNFRINLDVDQADATESRMVYFEYKKGYRSEDKEDFNWFIDNLDNLSRVTTHILSQQDNESRKEIKKYVAGLEESYKKKLDEVVEKNPKKYVAEHRITSNYTRLLGCYEHVFGKDQEFKKFIFEEILSRFAAAKANEKENAVLQQLTYMASSGRIKESWHYHYNNNREELYVSLGQMYEAYSEYKREKAVSQNQFKEILKDYFVECGGYEVATKRWYGKYYDKNNMPIEVDKPMHSYILTYEQAFSSDNLFRQLFPETDDQKGQVEKYTESFTNDIDNISDKPIDTDDSDEFEDIDDEVPF
ncbi:MAG: hypothetical protein GVX78_03575 [Bacteroidetes bacterium]|jgi:hypothetical protein|nr:hypothetical protein [Bacteroidota bacterium]